MKIETPPPNYLDKLTGLDSRYMLRHDGTLLLCPALASFISISNCRLFLQANPAEVLAPLQGPIVLSSSLLLLYRASMFVESKSGVRNSSFYKGINATSSDSNSQI